MPSLRRREKALLESDLSQLESGNLGLSESEKTKRMQTATRGAQGVAGSLQGNIARQSLGGGSQYTGMAQRAQEGIARQTAEASAQAAAQADDQSLRLQEAKRQEILGRLAQHNVNKQQTRQGVVKGIGQGLGTVVGGVIGGPAGATAGGTLGKGLGHVVNAGINYATGKPKNKDLASLGTDAEAEIAAGRARLAELQKDPGMDQTIEGPGIVPEESIVNGLEGLSPEDYQTLMQSRLVGV